MLVVGLGGMCFHRRLELIDWRGVMLRDLPQRESCTIYARLGWKPLRSATPPLSCRVSTEGTSGRGDHSVCPLGGFIGAQEHIIYNCRGVPQGSPQGQTLSSPGHFCASLSWGGVSSAGVCRLPNLPAGAQPLEQLCDLSPA